MILRGQPLVDASEPKLRSINVFDRASAVSYVTSQNLKDFSTKHNALQRTFGFDLSRCCPEKRISLKAIHWTT
jgi:hypothetical protein